MKIGKLMILLAGCCYTTLNAQVHTLTVNNGYGSGNYQVGDTVNIWSVAYDNTKTFTTWTEDIQYLKRPKEWHTTLVMPNNDVNLTASIGNMPIYNINYEQITGENNLKNVYFYFPSNLKGVIYLFHGTGGNAKNWTDVVEYRSFVNAAIADNYGIIITEAEEITLQTDLNGDGKLRWQGFPIDTVNGIDYLNIKALTDTFINRGDFTATTPKFSVGMSNGGSFSAAISTAFNYQAAVSYCASSAQAIFSARSNPFAFRMAKHDNNPQVGATGNEEARQSDSILSSRGVCHDYDIHNRQPIYPERFARIQGITITTSQSIFNELLSNYQINTEHYALPSDSIKSHFLSTPSNYPTIIGLSLNQKIEIINQIAASNAEHKFYSDFSYATLAFLDNPCGANLGIAKNEQLPSIIVYPNPASSLISIAGLNDVKINRICLYNTYGQLIKNYTGQKTIDISSISNGIYTIAIKTDKFSIKKKIVKE